MRTMSSAAPESAIGSASSTSRTTVRSGRTTSIVVGGTTGASLAPGKSAGVSPIFAAAVLADGEEPGSASADAALTETRAPMATSPMASLRSRRTNWRWDFTATSSGWADLMRGACAAPIRQR
jgi:hypothetical protein